MPASVPVLSNEFPPPSAAALFTVVVPCMAAAPPGIVPGAPDIAPVGVDVPLWTAAVAPVLLLVLPPVSAANVGRAKDIVIVATAASAVDMRVRCMVFLWRVVR